VTGKSCPAVSLESARAGVRWGVGVRYGAGTGTGWRKRWRIPERKNLDSDMLWTPAPPIPRRALAPQFLSPRAAGWYHSCFINVSRGKSFPGRRACFPPLESESD
jgi:hypothetical protein